jgi:hypothetical protein
VGIERRPERRDPYLVPLSFVWDGTALLFATPAASATARNLRATGKVRLGLGPTRDVVLIEGDVESLDPTEIATDVADHFAATTGFDPRRQTTSYLYLRIHPQRVQAWREANELDGRELMRAGRWLATS